MLDKALGLYRQKALERLASPEQLDEAVEIVRPRGWWWLSTLGALLLVALVWSILGRIPINVEGRGILLRPRQVAGQPLEVSEFSPLGSGQLVKLLVQEGDRVRQGQLIGEIAQPRLQAQVESKREELQQLLSQNRTLTGLETRISGVDRDVTQIKQRNLKTLIDDLEGRTRILRQDSLQSLNVQYKELQFQLSNNLRLEQIQTDLVNRQRPLARAGAISETALLQSERALVSVQEQVSNLLTKLEQVKLEIDEANEKYLENQDQLADYRAQLRELDTQEQNTNLQEQTRSTDRQGRIKAAQGELKQMEVNLRQNSQIISPYNGVVLSLFARSGQIVNTGQSLGQIRVEGAQRTILRGLAYFSVGEGKQIKSGMFASITPDSVKREEYGGIAGRVVYVSQFPVAQASAVEFVGDQALASALTANGNTIEVFVELEADPRSSSGYRWTASRGPGLNVSAGTTTTTFITVEERAPVSFILPLLRQWTGIY